MVSGDLHKQKTTDSQDLFRPEGVLCPRQVRITGGQTTREESGVRPT